MSGRSASPSRRGIRACGGLPTAEDLRDGPSLVVDGHGLKVPAMGGQGTYIGGPAGAQHEDMRTFNAEARRWRWRRRRTRGRAVTRRRASVAAGSGLSLDERVGPHRPGRLSGRRLLWTWTAIVTLGEALGFLVPAVVGVAAASLPLAIGMPSLLAASALEGAVLGASQQAVLHRVLPSLRRIRWIGFTAGAAVAAYMMGFVLASLGGIGSWVAVLGMAVGGVVLLLTIGAAQAVELRHHLDGAGRRVAWSAGAWLLGLMAFLAVATPLWHSGQPVAEAVAVGAAAGVVVAFIQAAITGFGLTRMLERRM